MQQPRVTFRHVILAHLHQTVPRTTGEDIFLGAIIIVIIPLLLLGCFLAAISTVVLRTFLWVDIALWSFLIGILATLLAWLFWRFWTIARALKAEQAAGAPLPVQTRSDTAHFIFVGVAALLMALGGVLLFLLPEPVKWLVTPIMVLVVFMGRVILTPREPRPRRLRWGAEA